MWYVRSAVRLSFPLDGNEQLCGGPNLHLYVPPQSPVDEATVSVTCPDLSGGDGTFTATWAIRELQAATAECGDLGTCASNIVYCFVWVGFDLSVCELRHVM